MSLHARNINKSTGHFCLLLCCILTPIPSKRLGKYGFFHQVDLFQHSFGGLFALLFFEVATEYAEDCLPFLSLEQTRRPLPYGRLDEL